MKIPTNDPRGLKKVIDHPMPKGQTSPPSLELYCNNPRLRFHVINGKYKGKDKTKVTGHVFEAE